jgi:hypothetical protein
MNAPIPLRPDPSLLKAAERQSFHRACAALLFSTGRGAPPAASVLKNHWGDDAQADRVLKAVSSPTSTTAGFYATQTVSVLPLLAPSAASLRLLALANPLNLEGVSTIRIPFIGATGRPSAPFIGEGSAAPTVKLTTAAVVLGPARKILIQAALTSEIQQASADTATTIIGQALGVAIEQSMDAVLFGSDPATAIAPAGLLYGVTPTASGGGTGTEGVADDVAALASAIAANGINPDGMALITTAALALKLRILTSPKFTNEILSSAAIPDGTLIGIVPAGLATGYQGSVQLQTARETVIHMEDAAALPIVDGAPANPSYSAFQQDLLVLKLRAWAAWTIQPGAIAVITGADW